MTADISAIDDKINDLKKKKAEAVEKNDFGLAQEHHAIIQRLELCREDAKGGKVDVRTASLSRPVYIE